MKKLRMNMAMVLLAGGFAASGVANTTVYTDNFNDGVRNKALWSVDSSFNGAFVEQNGRLNGYSGTRNPLDTYHAVTWNQKLPIAMDGHDTVEVEAALRVPMLPFSPVLPPDADCSLRLGLNVPGPVFRNVYVRFVRYPGGRFVQLAVNRPDHSTIAYGIFLSDDLPRYQFKLRYQTATGKLSVWTRAVAGETWIRRKTVDLNSEWQLAAGTPVAVQPYLMFSSYNYRVESKSALYFDNYRAVHNR